MKYINETDPSPVILEEMEIQQRYIYSGDTFNAVLVVAGFRYDYVMRKSRVSLRLGSIIEGKDYQELGSVMDFSQDELDKMKLKHMQEAK